MPIKTTVSATVLEEALNGTVIVSPLPLGQLIARKVITFPLIAFRTVAFNVLFTYPTLDR